MLTSRCRTGRAVVANAGGWAINGVGSGGWEAQEPNLKGSNTMLALRKDSERNDDENVMHCQFQGAIPMYTCKFTTS